MVSGPGAPSTVADVPVTAALTAMTPLPVSVTAPPAAVTPLTPLTAPTVSGPASTTLTPPVTLAASVPKVLACVSVKAPVPCSRRLAPLSAAPAASVTPAALRTTVAPGAVTPATPSTVPTVRAPVSAKDSGPPPPTWAASVPTLLVCVSITGPTAPRRRLATVSAPDAVSLTPAPDSSDSTAVRAGCTAALT